MVQFSTFFYSLVFSGSFSGAFFLLFLSVLSHFLSDSVSDPFDPVAELEYGQPGVTHSSATPGDAANAASDLTSVTPVTSGPGVQTVITTSVPVSVSDAIFSRDVMVAPSDSHESVALADLVSVPSGLGPVSAVALGTTSQELVGLSLDDHDDPMETADPEQQITHTIFGMR